MTLTVLIVLTLKFSIALNVFVLGLGATFKDATHLFRRPEKFLRALLSMYVVMPLIALALALTFDLSPAARFAVVALSVSPVPPILPKKALKAGGTENYSVGLLVAATLLAIVLVPVAMEVFERVFDVPLEMPVQSLAAVLLPYLLAPLAAGILVRAMAPAAAEWASGPVGILATALLLLSFIPVLIGARQDLLSVIGNGTVLAFAAFALAGLIAGHLLGGPEPEERTVLALYTSARHPGVAIAIAQVNFPDQQRLAIAAALVAVIVAGIVSAPYLKWTKRQALNV